MLYLRDAQVFWQKMASQAYTNWAMMLKQTTESSAELTAASLKAQQQMFAAALTPFNGRQPDDPGTTTDTKTPENLTGTMGLGDPGE